MKQFQNSSIDDCYINFSVTLFLWWMINRMIENLLLDFENGFAPYIGEQFSVLFIKRHKNMYPSIFFFFYFLDLFCSVFKDTEFNWEKNVMKFHFTNTIRAFSFRIETMERFLPSDNWNNIFEIQIATVSNQFLSYYVFISSRAIDTNTKNLHIC